MHGGEKVYPGAAAARAYVESDRSRVDDYYLAEGTGLAERFSATPDSVDRLGVLEGDGYERWVADHATTRVGPRGRGGRADS